MNKNQKLASTVLFFGLCMFGCNVIDAQIKINPVVQERTEQKVRKDMVMKDPAICTYNEYDAEAQFPVQVIEDFTGKGNVTIHRLGGVVGLGADNKGNVYEAVTNGIKGYVREIKKVGEYSGALQRPEGIAFDKQNRMYIIDAGLNQIIRIDDTGGGNLITFGAEGAGIGQFKNPADIAIDAKGRIYIADRGNSRIVRIDDMNGEGWRTYNGTRYVQDIAVDSKNRIHYILPDYDNVYRIDDIDGSNLQTFGGVYSRDFYRPSGIAIDRQDRIYISHMNASIISRMDDISGLGRIELSKDANGSRLFRRPSHIAVFYPVMERIDIR